MLRLAYWVTGTGWIRGHFQGGKDACHVTAKSTHPEAGTVAVVLQARPEMVIPASYQRFQPGTFLLATLKIPPGAAEQYRFLGWRIRTSESLLPPNAPDHGFRWNVTSDCEVTAVFTHAA
jgi:hypothetical protein